MLLVTDLKPVHVKSGVILKKKKTLAGVQTVRYAVEAPTCEMWLLVLTILVDFCSSAPLNLVR